MLPAAALAVALAATPAAGKPLAPGNWGGDHVAMVVTEANAGFEFDCAHGSTDGPIMLDANGEFDAAGGFVREIPGPTRQDGEKVERVRYVGRVEGDAMALTLLRSGSGAPPGRFELQRGQPPRLRRCQ